MKKNSTIQYTLLMGLCRVIGRLSNRVLYHVLTPMVYFVLYHVVRYRRNVVYENLAHSFPEKSQNERRCIERKFYRHLAEVFIDTMKLATISREEILERMNFVDKAPLEEIWRGKSWIAAMSHYGSWELTINYACDSEHRVLAVYRPLHSKTFDLFYQKVRSRFGTHPVPMNNILVEMLKSTRPGVQPAIAALIADQTPPAHEIKHWYRFLNQDTPFFSGMEKMALRLRLPIYFVHIRKIAPHHYEGRMIPMYDGKEKVAPNEITERYIHRLESMIRECPELWMWSHRRWKHKKPATQPLTLNPDHGD